MCPSRGTRTIGYISWYRYHRLRHIKVLTAPVLRRIKSPQGPSPYGAWALGLFFWADFQVGTHSQFNIFRALRREPRGQKPPNKAGQVSEWGRPDPQKKPWEGH